MRSRRSSTVVSLASLSLFAAATAQASGPVAIVQDITAPDAGVAFMDYVQAGDLVTLGAGERLVLGYFASCIEETITGGTVAIGEDRSTVTGGEVDRRSVNCDGGGLALTESQAARSGVIVFRNSAAPSEIDAPSIRLHGASPVIAADEPGHLVLRRLDAPEPVREFNAPDGIVDLAAHNIVLAPGGVYRAELTIGDRTRERVFEIDVFAVPGNAPLVSRLLRM